MSDFDLVKWNKNFWDDAGDWLDSVAGEGATKNLMGGLERGFEAVSDSLLGTTFGQERLQDKNIEFQQRTNERNIQHAMNMLNLQRQWALSDWDKVNAYNHPLQQMERFREAGLNPHLIYGSANNAPSAMIKSTTQSAPREDAPQYNIQAMAAMQAQAQNRVGMMLNAYQTIQDINLKKQQVENQTLLTDANYRKILTEAGIKDVELKYAPSLSQSKLELLGAQFNLTENKSAQSLYDLQKMPDLPEMQDITKKKLILDNQKIEEAIKLYEQQGKINQFDIDYIQKLKAMGMGADMIIQLMKLIFK